MSSYEPSPNFQSAVAYLSSSSAPSAVSTAIKLELYGLFKYLTASRMPTTSRPSIFDMTGRAKWDAWSSNGKKYDDPKGAEQRYLEIARSLGWTEQTKVETKVESTSSSTDDGDIWDKDDDTPRRSGAGLGVAVSSMAQPSKPEGVDDGDGLHGLVLANDVVRLTKFLDDHKEMDLNAPDEYGYAPIHLACDRGNVEIVRLLLERGADRNVKDPDDLTPLELSQEAGHVNIEALLTST